MYYVVNEAEMKIFSNGMYMYGNLYNTDQQNIVEVNHRRGSGTRKNFELLNV